MGNPVLGQNFERDGIGTLRCVVCGKDSLGRTEQAMRGHLTSQRHREAVEQKDKRHED